MFQSILASRNYLRVQKAFNTGWKCKENQKNKNFNEIWYSNDTMKNREQNVFFFSSEHHQRITLRVGRLQVKSSTSNCEEQYGFRWNIINCVTHPTSWLRWTKYNLAIQLWFWNVLRRIGAHNIYRETATIRRMFCTFTFHSNIPYNLRILHSIQIEFKNFSWWNLCRSRVVKIC